MERERIETDGAPGAIGPYSQGIASGGWVFTAGQIGMDPATGELADGVEAQTR
ncbi:MAG TPA: Rid family hydrolase, partial [Gemmatimonadota bacterium]|nr:Rid family hydrolase [Gemmatimonadota bacterium]